MGKRLFVGGLPYQVDDNRLKEVFSQVAPVESASVLMDRMTGQSKGFGFVEMTNDEDAQKAIQKLNGSDMGGRKIVVNEARPMEERPQRNFGDRNRGNFRRDDNRNSRSNRW